MSVKRWENGVLSESFLSSDNHNFASRWAESSNAYKSCIWLLWSFLTQCLPWLWPSSHSWSFPSKQTSRTSKDLTEFLRPSRVMSSCFLCFTNQCLNLLIESQVFNPVHLSIASFPRTGQSYNSFSYSKLWSSLCHIPKCRTQRSSIEALMVWKDGRTSWQPEIDMLAKHRIHSLEH